MNVMVAVDDSAASGAAVETAVRLFGQQPDVRFLLLGVVETAVPAGGGAMWAPMAPGLMTSWDRIVPLRDVEARAAVAHAADLVPSAERVLSAGDPARRICDAAEEHEVDVIVLGTTDKGLLRRLLDPPVTDAVVHGTTRPVLVVHDAS